MDANVPVRAAVPHDYVKSTSYPLSCTRGVAAFVIDLMSLAGVTALAVSLEHWWLQLVFAVLAGVWIGVLFTVGHDAAHNSLTPHAKLNQWIGRVSLLPSLHSFSLWVIGHNLTHHRWTNFAPRDYVWTPLDLQQYRALPGPRRLLYRFYRSAWGALAYYAVEIWAKHTLLPFRRDVARYERRHVFDSALVVGFGCAYVALLLAVNRAGTGEAPWWEPLLFGAVVPFGVWNILMGFVIYTHHTHPDVAWYNDHARWRREGIQAEMAVHVSFPGLAHRLFHSIMSHNAHHALTSTPFYHLDSAQAELVKQRPGRILQVDWSPRVHLEVVRRCKLFDFEAQRWMDFEGNYTS